MFYLVFIVDFVDGSPRSLAIYTYATESEALSSYHKNLGAWVNKDRVSHVLAHILTEDGGTVRSESWRSENEND